MTKKIIINVCKKINNNIGFDRPLTHFSSNGDSLFCFYLFEGADYFEIDPRLKELTEKQNISFLVFLCDSEFCSSDKSVIYFGETRNPILRSDNVIILSSDSGMQLCIGKYTNDKDCKNIILNYYNDVFKDTEFEYFEA